MYRTFDTHLNLKCDQTESKKVSIKKKAKDKKRKTERKQQKHTHSTTQHERTNNEHGIIFGKTTPSKIFNDKNFFVLLMHTAHKSLKNHTHTKTVAMASNVKQQLQQPSQCHKCEYCLDNY